MTLLEVTHETRYEYAAPVSPAMHLAHLEPTADEGQELLDHSLHIDPSPDELITETDVFGNVGCRFAVIAAHRELTVRATSRLRLQPRFNQIEPARSPPWEAVRERLRYVARAPFEPAVEFVQPSPFVPRLDALRDYAASSLTPERAAGRGGDRADAPRARRLQVRRRQHGDRDATGRGLCAAGAACARTSPM